MCVCVPAIVDAIIMPAVISRHLIMYSVVSVCV